MDEAGLWPDVFGKVREEGDDVVLGLLLDGLDPIDLELAALAQALAASFGMVPISACASQADVSISSQIRNLFSGAQMAVIGGRA